MKRMYVAFTAMLLGMMMVTGCGDNSKKINLVKVSETAAGWGLDMNGLVEVITEEETEADVQTESYADTDTVAETEEQGSLVNTISTLADGSRLLTIEERTATSNGNLNVRESANASANAITALKNGETVTVIGITDTDWAQVVKDGETGFSAAQYLYGSDGVSLAGLFDRLISQSEMETTQAETTQAETSQAETSQAESSQAESGDLVSSTAVTTGDVNLRAGIGPSTKALTVIPKGSQVTVLEKTSNWWWKISYNGQEGYASAPYLSAQE